MPQIDISFTIAAIIGVCALLSPILTTIINNLHQTKMRKLDMQQKLLEQSVMHKKHIFESYLSSTGKTLKGPTEKAIQEYGESYPIALLYAPEPIREDMILLNEMMGYSGGIKDWNGACLKLDEISVKLSEILQGP